MRLKKIVIIASVLGLLGTASVLADDVYENYKAKAVEVFVNEKKVETKGLLVEMDGAGKTLLPIRDVANELGAFVEWDPETQSAHLYKPNVDLILATASVEQNKTKYGLFQKVDYNQPAPPFVVIAQIDNMKTDFYSYRFSILDPDGNIIYERALENKQAENDETDGIVWKRTPLIELTFDQKGTYVVELQIKLEKDSDYLTVSRKGFLSQ